MAAHGGAESTGSAAGSLSAPCVRVAASVNHASCVAALQCRRARGRAGAINPRGGSARAPGRKCTRHKPEVGARLTGRAPPSSRKWARHEPEVDPPQAGPGGEGLALTLLPSLRLWLLAPGSFGFVLVSLRSGRVLVSLLLSVI